MELRSPAAAPDCCGTGSSLAQIGLSNHSDAVTVTAYFFNSSPRAVRIDGAIADLPGASVLEVAPFAGPSSFEMPPQNLAAFPHVVDAHSDARLAISFLPERCEGDSSDWGTVSLDLEVAGDHWYPTLSRTYELPEPVVPAVPGRLGVLPPAALDGAFVNIDHPLEAACVLLGR